jgi:hypothetical protein
MLPGDLAIERKPFYQRGLFDCDKLTLVKRGFYWISEYLFQK